jgi:hypothetical protein
MALCRICGTEISPEDAVCPNCGYLLKQVQPMAPLEQAQPAPQPVNESKRTYFAVITLIGLAIGLLPNLFTVELEVHVIIPYEIGSVSYVPVLFDLLDFATFLISPCLFFAILYLYGKRTVHHFSENYLRVILLLFFGSALGFAVYMVSWPYLEGVSRVFNDTFWLGFVVDVVTEGFRDALIGFAALGLSYLVARNLTNQTVPV